VTTRAEGQMAVINYLIRIITELVRIKDARGCHDTQRGDIGKRTRSCFNRMPRFEPTSAYLVEIGGGICHVVVGNVGDRIFCCERH
jgi:hypothetical protein